MTESSCSRVTHSWKVIQHEKDKYISVVDTIKACT